MAIPKPSNKDISTFLNSLTKENLEKIKDQTFAEVILEASGIDLPLPTQEEVIAFYKEIKEPTNKLTKIDPKDWSKIQYLEYQSDVKKFQIKSRFKGIKNALKLKKEKNKEKGEKERKKFKLDFITNLFRSVEKETSENTPEDLKPKGSQKLGELAGNITKILLKVTIPSILNIIEQTALDTFEDRKLKVLEELGINEQLEQLSSLTDPVKLKEVTDRLCPTQDVLENIIRQRDGIVEFLNNQQVKVNSLSTSVNVVGDFADGLQETSAGAALSAFITNQLAKVAVIGPVIAPLRSIITDLDVVNQAIIFKKDGNPRIPPLRGAVSNFSVPLNQVNTIITKIVLAVAPIDEIILLCAPNTTLNTLSTDVLATITVQLSAEETEDGALYKGFRLKIEERPYTDTTTQRRAVGVNTSGVVLISGEYSFASDPNVLLNEIKFLIDRDNLKAY